MDQCTYEVRLQHWKNIISQCQLLPRDRPQNNGWMKMVSANRPITVGSVLSDRKHMQKWQRPDSSLLHHHRIQIFHL